jgi:fumarate reductase flavoprotein subunit
MDSQVDYDVIVIGAGGAGMAAAATAAEAGCAVLVLEAEAKTGGSTGHSEGVFNAADSSLQHALGFEDTIESYYNDYMALNAYRQQPALIRVFCEQSTPTLEWLISLGVEFPQQLGKKVKGAVWPSAPHGGGLYVSGIEPVPRGHAPLLGGQAYIDALDNRLGAFGGQVVLNTRVTELLVEDGAVVGVKADGQDLRAHAVMLACGGFGHDLELLRKYFPDAYDAQFGGSDPATYSAAGSRGDCIRLGLQAGAEIIGENCGLLSAAAFLPNMPPAALAGWQPKSLIYVNAQGRRFSDETASYAVMPGLMKEQGFDVWGIFDEASRLRSDPTAGGAERGWDPQMVLDAVEKGDMRSAPSIQDLGRACGMNPLALESAVRDYNEDLATGVDRWFLRDLHYLSPIAQGPFYAFRYRPWKTIVTGAGPRIDPHARVMGEDGRVVPGFYAAGEAGAGVLGQRYVGGGNSVGNALTMGRVAGMTMAREIKARAVGRRAAAPAST